MRSVVRSEEHTSELQSRRDLVCRLLLEKKNHKIQGESKVVLWHGYNDDEAKAIKTLASQFNASHRDVQVTVQFQGNNDFFFNDTATTEIYTLSLHDALPI